MSVDSGRHVAGRGFNRNDYSHEEVWLSVDKVADLPYPLRDVCGAHCSSLMQASRVHQLYYACDMMFMMLVLFSSVLNPTKGLRARC